MKSDKELDSILERLTAEIRDEAVPSSVTEEAAGRVWARLATDAVSTPPLASSAAPIHGCRDFQSLIPAYLRGELSEARALLLEDHTHECVPCRRAMKEARSGRVAPSSRQTARSRRPFLQPVVLRWGIAAALVIGLGLLAVPLVQRYLPFGPLEATVQAAEGGVYRIDDTQSAPLGAGQKIERGELIRTARDAHAFIRLGDGSVIEVNDRSELSLTRNGQGTTIHLGRGQIIVEAAKQEQGHLFIDEIGRAHV